MNNFEYFTIEIVIFFFKKKPHQTIKIVFLFTFQQVSLCIWAIAIKIIKDKVIR